MIVFHGPATNVHEISSTSDVAIGCTVAFLGIGTLQIKVFVHKTFTILSSLRKITKL